MKRKQTIGGIEYNFEFTNRSFIELDDIYENGGEIYNGVLNGDKHMSNSVKLVAVSCVEGMTEDFILDNATGQEFIAISSLANELIYDYMGINKTESNGDNSEDSKKK